MASFLRSFSDGFSGIVQFCTPSFLGRGSRKSVKTDEKSVNTNQNKCPEDASNCCDCTLGGQKQCQNLPLDKNVEPNCSKLERARSKLDHTPPFPLSSMGLLEREDLG